MGRKTALMLTELLVMLLVFSLAAAACLGIFAQARLMAEETARRDRAVLLARNTAELLKAGRDPALADIQGLELEISRKNSGIPGFCQAKITVIYEKAPVFILDTGWQEEGI